MSRTKSSLAVLVLLGAIPARPARSAAGEPDTVVFAGIADVQSLDPNWYGIGDVNSHAIANIYEGLVAFRGTSLSDFEPRLSTAVPSRENGLLSKDGRAYRFPIRSGVRFHDGSALTPEDVRYSLLRFLLVDPAGRSAYTLIQPVLGVESTRDDQGRLRPGIYRQAAAAVQVANGAIVLRLARPFPGLLSILANFGFVLPKAWALAHGEWDGSEETLPRHNNPKREEGRIHDQANGTGPFALERWDRQARTVLLRRHENYWRTPARLRRVVLRTIEDFSARKLMLQSGDADVIFADAALASTLRGLPAVEMLEGLGVIGFSPLLYFHFNVEPRGNPNIGSGRFDGDGIPPDFFRDPDARRAVAHAVDYEAFQREALQGKGRLPAGILPAALTPEGSARPWFRFDPAAAAAHLRRAWGGQAWEKGFRFTLIHNEGNTVRQNLCQMLKRNLEALNPKFHVNVRPVQLATQGEMFYRRHLVLWAGAWYADFADPYSVAFPLMHSQRSNRGYRNPEADRIIAQAAQTSEAGRKAALYGRLNEIAFEDVPVIPVSEDAKVRVQRSWLRGYVFHPLFPAAPWGSYYYDLWKEP